jgi:hypothetical protein
MFTGLRKALIDRERQIGEITARFLDAHPDSLRAKLRNIRSFCHGTDDVIREEIRRAS